MQEKIDKFSVLSLENEKNAIFEQGTIRFFYRMEIAGVVVDRPFTVPGEGDVAKIIMYNGLPVAVNRQILWRNFWKLPLSRKAELLGIMLNKHYV